MTEALVTQEIDILAEFVRNEYIFQRFPFLGNFQFTVIIAAFVVVVILDKVAVEIAFFGQDFLHQNKDTAGVESVINIF